MSPHASMHALLNPDNFFSEQSDITAGAGQVLVTVAGLHVVGYYVFLFLGAVIASQQHASHTVPSLLADLGAWIFVQGVLLALVVVLNWLVMGAVLHVAIKLGNGTGTYSDTLAIVAWSSPAVLVALVSSGVGFLLGVSGNTLVMSFDAKIAAVSPAITIGSIVGGLLTLLWQGSVWSAGLQRIHEVKRQTASQATAAAVICGAVTLFVV